MAVKVLRSLPEIGDVAEAWAALADASGARHNMQPFWCLPWWSHLGQGEMHVVVVESEGGLAALAPLYRTRSLGVDTLKFLGSDLLGVGEVLVGPGQEAAGDELWAFLLDRPRSVLDLRQHRLAGAGVEAFRRAESDAGRAILGPASPFVAIDRSWDDYWRGRRTKFKSDLERRERVAQREEPPVTIEVAVDRGDVAKRLPDVTRIFDAAEGARTKLHFFAGANRPFTIDALHQAADQSRLALFVLYIGEKPVGTAFTFRSGTVMGIGGTRFDPAYSRYSPGQLLLRRIIEHAFASDCTEFDFGPRDVAYKREWNTGIYDTVHISAFSSRAARAFHVGRSVLTARLGRSALGA